MHADRREQLESASTGEIVTLVGLRGAHTGETYCHKSRLLALEAIDSYAPVITLALEPRNADEGKVLDEALERYAAEDPTLEVRMDEETACRMVSGMGELHLDVLLERMSREYGISPRAGHPQVILRETVRKEADGQGEFDRELGKEHHFGHVELHVRPLPRGTGNSVLVIEHNLDVIKVADYLIDLGPEGGDKGGEIVCEGTPEEVAACEKSYTGQFLKKMLGKR